LEPLPCSRNALKDFAENPFLVAFSQIPREDTPYFAALGRFITQYAAAEAGVHLLCRHLSGLSDDKARALISGMRLRVTNALTAKSALNIEENTFDLPALGAMEADCRTIFLRLVQTITPLDPSGQIDAETAQQPWLYKPVRPIPQKKPPRKARKARQRQPGA
jgi:hypothetical protein